MTLAMGEQMRSMTAAAVKGSLHVVCLATVTIVGAMNAMATEEAAYTVVTTDGAFEIRDYAPNVVAETLVEGNLEEAGNTAFNRLFRYISGGNRSREKVAMTAPVAQQRVREQWAVSFMMPATYTLETLPAPEDPLVTLRQVPARRIAAVRYSGSWSEKGYLRHKSELESWMSTKGLASAGEPQWARYNSPFTLWFLRRNEILIPVAGSF